MRKADVFYNNIPAGQLMQLENGDRYCFQYAEGYTGKPISQTMPVRREVYEFDDFPPFFDGLLPEGFQLEALLGQRKLDRNDRFGQLLQVGADTVGAVTVFAHPSQDSPR